MKIILQNTNLVFKAQASIDKNYFENPIEVDRQFLVQTEYVNNAVSDFSLSSNGNWNGKGNSGDNTGGIGGIVSAIIPVSVGDTIIFSGNKHTSGAICGFNSLSTTGGPDYGFVMSLLDFSTETSYKNKKITITQEMVNAGIVCVRASAKNDGTAVFGKL